MSQPVVEEKNLKGISASPGICIGKAYLVDKEGVDVVKKYYLKEEKIKSEINPLETGTRERLLETASHLFVSKGKKYKVRSIASKRP